MPKGKDFFSRKSKSDDFETPYSMTQQLFENEIFDDRPVLEPACGNGAISKILEKKFSTVISSDVERCFITSDFYDYKYIITNPPFSLWDDFVEKAKAVATEKFAFLGRIEFLTGLKRFNENVYYDPEYPLTKIYLFVRKVNLSFTDQYPALREDGKYPCGMFHYAWFIFENFKKYNQITKDIMTNIRPTIKMINNNPYILRKDKNIIGG
jgi:hypothetical protein